MAKRPDDDKKDPRPSIMANPMDQPEEPKTKANYPGEPNTLVQMRTGACGPRINAGAGDRVHVPEEIQEPTITGDGPLDDRRRACLGQSLPLRLGHGGRELAEGLEKDAFLRAVHRELARSLRLARWLS